MYSEHFVFVFADTVQAKMSDAIALSTGKNPNKRWLVMVYNTTNSPKGLQCIDGDHPHAEALIDFYQGRGFEHAHNEEHAQTLLNQGVPCYLIKDGNTQQ